MGGKAEFPWVTVEKSFPEEDSTNSNAASLNHKTSDLMLKATRCLRVLLKHVLHVMFYNVVVMEKVGNALLQRGMK